MNTILNESQRSGDLTIIIPGICSVFQITKIMESTNGRLHSVQKLYYGVGHVFNDVCGTMWFTYILVYLQFVMKVTILQF